MTMLDKKKQIIFGSISLLFTVLCMSISNYNLVDIKLFGFYIVVVSAFYFIPVLLRKDKGERYYILGTMVVISIIAMTGWLVLINK